MTSEGRQARPRRLFWLWLAVAGATLVSTAGLAGVVEGSIFQASGPAAGVDVVIQCATANVTAMTGPDGSFSVFVPASGECALSALGGSFRIGVYENPVRYDLVLIDGQLQRR
jgi:hypothetical protein